MARYRMQDGTVVDTSKASQVFNEDTRWDGRNLISCATGDQWVHQTLYRSRRGRYYVEHTSQWQGSRASAEWVSPQEAVRWLLQNNYEEEDLPEDLRALVDEVSE